MINYSIAGKRGQWPAPEDTSLSLSYLSYPWKQANGLFFPAILLFPIIHYGITITLNTKPILGSGSGDS